MKLFNIEKKKKAIIILIIGIILLIIGSSFILASIIIIADISYPSNQSENITQETGYAHLNLSDNNIIFYLPMDVNTSTTVRDYSNNNNDGTITNATFTTQGMYGGAYKFNGTGSYINLGDIDAVASVQLSLSAWVKFNQIWTGGSNAQGIIAQDDWEVASTRAFALVQHDTSAYDGFRFQIINETPTIKTIDCNITPVTNTWYHVVGTYNGSLMSIYSNGVLCGTIAHAGSVKNIIQDVCIGFRCGVVNAAEKSFNGTIDEVMVWNIGLSQSNVTNLYNNQSARFSNTGNMTFWDLNIAGNNTANVSLLNCGTLLGSNLSVNFNGGNITNFTNCNATNVDIPNYAGKPNMTIWMTAGANDFYTPLTIGNITIDEWSSGEIIPPNITILSPLNITYNQPINYTINVTDTSTIDSCWYSINSGVSNETMQNLIGNIYNFSASAVYSEGGYKAEFFCNDSNNNINNTEDVSFMIDTTQNAPTIIYPSNTTYNYSVSALNYTHVGASYCWASNNSGITNTTAITAGQNFTGLNSSEGSNNFTLWCNDSVNNLNLSSVTFSIDTTYPLISITTPANNTNYTNINLDINYTWTEINKDSCWYSNDTYLKNTTLAGCLNLTTIVWAEGQHNITIWINDTAGNTNQSSITFGIDSIPPNISIYTPLNQTYNTTAILFNVSINEQGNCSYTLNNGIYNYTMASIGGLNFSGTNLTMAQGQHNVTFYCNDTIGNKNQSSKSFYIDSINPDINITFPENKTYMEKVPNINYTVSDINLQACWYSIDNGVTNTTLTCGTNVTGLSSLEGDNSWIVGANDSLGNTNYSRIVFTKDTNPDIQFTSQTDINATNYSRKYIIVNVTANDTSLQTIVIRLYNSTKSLINTSIHIATAQNTSFYMNFTNLTDDLYYVNATANDTSNNQNSTETRQIRVDITPPTITFYSPLNQSYSSSTMALKVNAVDLSAIDTYKYSLDLSSNTSFTPNITLFSLGWNADHTIWVYVNDTAGNNNSKLVSFYIGDTPVSTGGGGGSGGTTDDINKTILCKTIYYFMVQTMLNYTEDDILNLSVKIVNTTGVNLSILGIKEYLNYFDYYCGPFNYTKPKLEEIKELLKKERVIIVNCSTDLNTTVFFFPIDLAIPTFIDIYIGNQSCEFINFWRWFVRIKKTTEDNYYIDGIRTWIFVLFLIALSGYFVYRYTNNPKKQKK